MTFVRHGESVSNAGGVTQAHAGIPLSARGRQQARLLADHWRAPPTAVFVSEFSRTAETAAPLCDRFGLSPVALRCLNEFSSLDHTLLEGMVGAERRPLAERYWERVDPDFRTGPLADTFAEFNARVSQFLSHMAELPHGCLVVGHGIWFGLLVWRLAGREAETSEEMRCFRQFQRTYPMPNCAVYQLQRDHGVAWQVQADGFLTDLCQSA